jgi:DNA polymerase III alpha subunit (gram-positive type)
MRLLVLDTETTGLIDSTPPPDLIEVAAALYCTETKTVLSTLQFIIPNGGINPGKDINGISEDALKEPMILGMKDIFSMLFMQADFIIAHNIKFDSHFVLREWEELKDKKEWICTYADIKFPKTKRSQVLSHIAVDHGILVTDAHRAVGDVQTLTKLLEKVPDLEEQITRVVNLRKNGKYYITDESHGRIDNKLSKEAGFKWNFDLKGWGKWLLPDEVNKLEFPVVQKTYK